MRLKLFVAACLIGGFGGFAGSAAGGLVGRHALFAGGTLGGMLIAPLTAWVAVRRGWVPAERYWATAAGAAIGFLLAALIAVNTLSSPVGPVLSTLLIGLGAVVGGRPGR